MKKIIMLVSAVTLLFALSCKKNSQDNATNKDMPNATAKQDNGNSYRDYLAKAAEKNIMSKLSTPKSKVATVTRLSGIPSDGNFTSGPTCCSGLVEGNALLEKVVNNPGDCGNTVIATFYWTVWESVCTTSPAVNYTFTVDAGFGTPRTGTAILIDEYYTKVEWFCCHPNGLYLVKTFSVDVVMPVLEFSVNETTNTVTGTNSCGTNSVTTPCTLSFAYCGNPAIVFVSGIGLTDAVAVSSECSLCFTPPHVECPVNGTFKYKVSGTPTWTTIPINGSFNLIPIPVSTLTNFDYECVYNYGSPLNCSSSTKSGTFFVNP